MYIWVNLGSVLNGWFVLPLCKHSSSQCSCNHPVACGNRDTLVGIAVYAGLVANTATSAVAKYAHPSTANADCIVDSTSAVVSHPSRSIHAAIASNGHGAWGLVIGTSIGLRGQPLYRFPVCGAVGRGCNCRWGCGGEVA